MVETFAAYGLGWQVMDFRGRKMLWHTGNADGMPSCMVILPDQKLGVVVLLNSWSASTLHGAIASRVLDTYLGVESRGWSAEAVAGVWSQRSREETGRHWLAEQIATVREPGYPLAAYVGVYEDSLYGPIRVWLDQRRLAMQMARGPIADLTPHGGDSLFVHWRDPLFGETLASHVTFVTGSRGTKASLRMPVARDTVTARRGSGMQ